MLTSFHIARYLQLADFEVLRDFLQAVGFVPIPEKERALGFTGVNFSSPLATFRISSLDPRLPPGIAQDLRSAPTMLVLETSDPQSISEIARRMRLEVRLVDSEASVDDGFSIKMPGGIILSVRRRSKQTQERAGNLDGSGKRFGIVVARFNSFITERLLESAVDGLLRSGAESKNIQIVRVPGAFEIPLAARTLAETKKYEAIICIGCLLRGDTAHYDVIVNEVTRGIGQSAQETGVPHAFGVLTCDTLEQAIDRAGLKMGNKGFEAALAAVEMANLKETVAGRSSSVVRKNKGRGKTSKR
jgi:6,7-dimethyl-8-ribityllumazine synthase